MESVSCKYLKHYPPYDCDFYLIAYQMKNPCQKAGKSGILGKVLGTLLIITQEQQHSKILAMGNHPCKWKPEF